MSKIVKFKKLHPGALLPTYACPGDSGMDLYACFDNKFKDWDSKCLKEDYFINVLPGERILIPTELSVELPEGYEAQVRSKSGLALKKGIVVLNSPGTVDEAYRGPLGVILINTDASYSFSVKNYTKVAQLVIKPIEQFEIVEVDELNDTVRGKDGFGHSGLEKK
jgi:dUTP pyrophosphatase